MSAKSPLLTLNNGIRMPALGLGVFQSSPDETAQAVETAIADGYRLIDTAAAYANEREVGEGIRRSGVDRSEIFVTTKLWMTSYGYESALRAFDASMRKLGLEYLDLYLLHWPFPSNFEATLESYRAAEKLLSEGRTRAIGVSNFSEKHLENLMARRKIVPAVNQVELHPFFIQRELRAAHKRLGIVTQSWSPIGGVHNRKRRADPNAPVSPLEHPTIARLAAKYGKTPAQVLIRWHIEHGLSVIPKSAQPQRIAENIDIFDFALSKDDIAMIDGLDTGARTGSDPDIVNATTFPVKIED